MYAIVDLETGAILTNSVGELYFDSVASAKQYLSFYIGLIRIGLDKSKPDKNYTRDYFEIMEITK